MIAGKAEADHDVGDGIAHPVHGDQVDRIQLAQIEGAIIVTRHEVLLGPVVEVAHVVQLLEPLPANKVSLAVLPLASPGGDARQERLADGIAEDLIAELGRYRNIVVIAKSSSFTYKGKTVDARQVGRDLGVRYVLEGDLETDPEQVRVAVQLIDAGQDAGLV